MDKLTRFFLKNTEKKQTVMKNSFWLFLSEASGRLLKMALIIYAARVLGAEGWGIFSYAISIGSLMMIFSDIGLGSLITREISQKKEGYLEYVSTAIFLRNAVLLISTILVFIVIPYISHIEEAKTLFPLIAMIFFFDSLRELLIAINRASEKMEREMIVKTVMGLATFVSGIILLKIN